MRLAVIPARGGSKRIPRKNIKDFCGRPMIAWPIQAALDSGCFDRIIVSTDDDEIAQVAQASGAACPFMRPADLSDDHTPTRPVIAHAIEYLQNAGEPVSYACCIYATAALTSPSALRLAFEKLEETKASYVFPILPFPAPIERSLRQSPSGHVRMVMPEHFTTRSQDLEQAWHDAGQFYWARSDTWCVDAPIFTTKSVGVPVSPDSVCDIDTPEDWTRAAALFRLRNPK